MKLYLSILLCLSMTAVTLNAQDKDIKLGINLGLASIDGDVDSAYKSGATAAVNLSKALNHKWSLIAGYTYGKTKGLDDQPTYQYAGYSGQYLPSFQNQSHSIDVSINRNIFIKKSRLYFGLSGGIGVTATKTLMNLLNSDKITYSNQVNYQPYRLVGSPNPKCNVGSPDYEFISYDQTYETLAEQQQGATALGDHQLFITVPVQFSVMFMATERLDLGLSMNTRITTNDYIDGIGTKTQYNGETRETNNADLYKSYRLLAYYRLSNFVKKDEILSY